MGEAGTVLRRIQPNGDGNATPLKTPSWQRFWLPELSEKAGRFAQVKAVRRCSYGNWQRLGFRRPHETAIARVQLCAFSQKAGCALTSIKIVSFGISASPFRFSPLDGWRDRFPLISRLTNHWASRSYR